MAQLPPRPAPPRAGGPPSPRANPPLTQPGPSKLARPTYLLGRYRVVDELGIGGMASVHLARMDGPGGFQKWVAIKRIHPHLVEDDQFVDMFLDEARIAAGINHANVAQVFDLGKDDNTYWIAMEYLHGEPLREVIRRGEERGTRFTPALAARICADAAEGLHAAHELRGKNGQLLGLVHRDVTPHNLFLTYDGYTKVVDFGIAKVADRLSSTRAGTLKGKLAYMSPEQVRGAELDRTTDIFALGVVLWETTTNQRLFRMDTDLDTLEKVQACVVPPPSTLVPGYPKELETIVLKALAKQKEQRYQTAREFSRALQGYLMRAGLFVDSEEVAKFVRTLFADRISKRDEHLAWAGEVTSTVNVEQLWASKPASADRPAAGTGGGPATKSTLPGPQALPSGSPQPPGPFPLAASRPALASASLLDDDDEDLPTRVAHREDLEGVPRAQPRPAGGLPPPGVPPTAPRPAVPSRATYGANADAPSASFTAPQFPPLVQGYPAVSDRTAAPRRPPEDLGATMTLPPDLGGLYEPAPQPQFSAQRPPGLGAPGFGAPGFGPSGYGANPAPTFGAPTFGSPPPAPMFGVPMNIRAESPGLPPTQGETGVSMPRPNPGAAWPPLQGKPVSDRRSPGMVIAVVSLTALCVTGIGALVYFKYAKGTSHRGEVPSTHEAMPVVVSAPPVLASATANGDEAAAAPSGAPSGVASGASSPAASFRPAPPPAVRPAVAGTLRPTAGFPREGTEEPGFLTILCNPACNDVADQGKSLGPAPFRVPVRPGTHRLTLKSGASTKVISVIVVSGQVSAQRVSMQ